MRLLVLEGSYAIARLPAAAPEPDWPAGPFVSVTRTADELSVVCAEESVPNDVHASPGWRCLRIEGTIPFEAVGVAASFAAPLAAAGISIFIVSTFDTDYLLVRSSDYERALDALRDGGFEIGG